MHPTGQYSRKRTKVEGHVLRLSHLHSKPDQRLLEAPVIRYEGRLEPGVTYQRSRGSHCWMEWLGHYNGSWRRAPDPLPFARAARDQALAGSWPSSPTA